MDNSKKNGSAGSNRCWTNERHVRFLNSIEASFVRAMFENNPPRSLRLDRQLPDCFESTQDLVKDRRRRHSTPDVAEYPSARTDKKNKRISSYDQVVPQLAKGIDDGGRVKDEKERQC